MARISSTGTSAEDYCSFLTLCVRYTFVYKNMTADILRYTENFAEENPPVLRLKNIFRVHRLSARGLGILTRETAYVG